MRAGEGAGPAEPRRLSVAKLLPAAERATVPWRNGGGTTQTVAAWPLDSDLDVFGWRLSIAEVTAAGPFSSFPGVERHLAVIDGRLELRIDDRPSVIVDVESEPFVFAGDADVTGVPLGGPARDFNLMLDRARYRGSMRRVSGAALREERRATTVLVAMGAATIKCDDAAFGLSHTDALLIVDAREIVVDGSAWLVEICPR